MELSLNGLLDETNVFFIQKLSCIITKIESVKISSHRTNHPAPGKQKQIKAPRKPSEYAFAIIMGNIQYQDKYRKTIADNNKGRIATIVDETIDKRETERVSIKVTISKWE